MAHRLPQKVREITHATATLALIAAMTLPIQDECTAPTFAAKIGMAPIKEASGLTGAKSTFRAACAESVF